MFNSGKDRTGKSVAFKNITQPGSVNGLLLELIVGAPYYVTTANNMALGLAIYLSDIDQNPFSNSATVIL